MSTELQSDRRCKQKITTTEQGLSLGTGFPLAQTLMKYSSALLKSSRQSCHLMSLIFSLIPQKRVHRMVREFSVFCSDEEVTEVLKEEVLDASDFNDVTQGFMRALAACDDESVTLSFESLLRDILQALQKPISPSYLERAAQLKQKLNLDDDELAVLEWACCYRLSHEFEGIVDELSLVNKAGVLSVANDVSIVKIRQILSKNGPLHENEMLTVDARRVRLDEGIFDFLLGTSGADFSAHSFGNVESSSLGLDSFELLPEQTDTLQKIICSKGAASILFFGKSGTGKTELSKVLADCCDRPAVLLRCRPRGTCSDRKKALLETVNSVSEETVIIVDEADTFLISNGPSLRGGWGNKAWINDFIDTSRHKVIWIISDISAVDESALRRFAYSVRFEMLTARQRSTIWDTQLRNHRIKRHFSSEAIEILSNEFSVSPGMISHAVRTVSQCAEPQWTARDARSMVREVLTAQARLTEKCRPSKQLRPIHSSYDPQALNTDADLDLLLTGFDRARMGHGDYGVNLLFWGWPGTGKTEFGKYIASRVGKELMVRRMSDLQSKYIGDTEKNISEAFRQAEEREAILFIDEADSIFINRQMAQRSWETTQTNEVLTQMENFKGILICCTNLLDNLDEAALRRFAFKIKFLPLTNDGKRLLYRKYFGFLKKPVTPELEMRLDRVRNLCPGDLKAVWQRISFLGETISQEAVLDELEKEVGYKRGGGKSPIGFGSAR